MLADSSGCEGLTKGHNSVRTGNELERLRADWGYQEL